MTVLVVGASGEIGREVVRALRERGAAVRALVRKTPVEGCEAATGDLADRASVERAATGCDAAVFITPHSPAELTLGMNVVDACEAANVRRLVYVSAFHPLAKSAFMQRLSDAVMNLAASHYKAKLAVERRVRASKLSPVVLCPTNFYQNDELGIPELLAGTYAQPLGRKLGVRVDTRDIGDAAARAVLDDLPPGAYPLVGPGMWNGETCAQVWSAALGKPIGYAGDDLARWQSTVGARMPPDRAADFAKTYRAIQRFGVPASARVRKRSEELLGRPARDYASYVEERAAQLSSTAAG